MIDSALFSLNRFAQWFAYWLTIPVSLTENISVTTLMVVIFLWIIFAFLSVIKWLINKNPRL